MSVNSLIVSLLAPFGDPVEYGVYNGKLKSYYVFNFTTAGGNFADDEPGHERNLVQVHYFCPLNVNSTGRIAKTKQALFAAGFSWPAMIDASDTESRHFVFECEYAEGVIVNG